ncbi:KAP family P-loop NTPase fold protein [Cetobacterium ceti]
MNIKEIYDKNLFNRKSHIKILTEYISDYEEECKVMSIHSPWGTGKTTFIELWKYHLENDENLKNKYYPIYFNAWKNDDSQNPLISLLIELSKIEDFKNISTLSLISNIGNILVNKAPKFLIKSLLGLVPIDSNLKKDIFEIINTLFNDGINGENLKKAINEANKEKIEQIIGQYDDFKIEFLRCELKELFKKKLEEFQNKTDKKIIFFIDELDRCRPTFAIETLEIIKHLFCVQNYNFILSWDLEQLSYSIGTIYGANMNTGGYLRRFIDFEYSLPKISTFDYIKYKSNSSCKYLFDHLINAFDFSMRDINKIINLKRVNNNFSGFDSMIYFNNTNKNIPYLQLFGYLFLLLKYKEPIYHIKLKNRVLLANEKEELINILKKYSDSAIISYNSPTLIKPITKEVFEQLINIFLTINYSHLNIVSNVKITEDITIDISQFIDRDSNINYLLDITL